MEKQDKQLYNSLLKEEKGEFSNYILEKYSNLDSSFTAVFYGVVERKYTLDYILSKYLTKNINALPVEVLIVLRIGLYKTLFMKSIPTFAAVSESVNLVKATKFKDFSGLINAVLRNASKYDIAKLHNKEPRIKYSVNDWIYNSVHNQIGKENAEMFFEDALRPSPIFVVVNTLKTDAESLLKTNGFSTTKFDNILLSNDHHILLDCIKKGLCFVQDISAASSVFRLDLSDATYVLDLCGAPGGKSFDVYLSTNGKSEITCCDINKARLNILNENIDNLGFSIKTRLMDATEFSPDLGLFDICICDVPCSGIGTIRKKPEIKYKSISKVNELIPIQRSILNNAAKYINKNGKIIYSTCTLNYDENRGNIEHFINLNKEFKIDSEVIYHAAACGGDGFYSCVLKRR